MIINIKNKKDLITLDFRIMQIRYLKENKEIVFIRLTENDILGYEYLFKQKDKTIFLSCLKDDLADRKGIFLNIKDLEVLK